MTRLEEKIICDVTSGNCLSSYIDSTTFVWPVNEILESSKLYEIRIQYKILKNKIPNWLNSNFDKIPNRQNPEFDHLRFCPFWILSISGF